MEISLSRIPTVEDYNSTLSSHFFELFCIYSFAYSSTQDNLQSVAETAVVGFPHPVKGEGPLKKKEKKKKTSLQFVFIMTNA